MIQVVVVGAGPAGKKSFSFVQFVNSKKVFKINIKTK